MRPPHLGTAADPGDGLGMADEQSTGRRQGRHIYDPDLVARLLSERESSGETYVSLSARSGIPAPTLRWHGGRRGRMSGSKFVEVTVAEDRTPLSTPPPDLRVIVHADERLREVVVRAGFDASELRRLVGALEQSC